jgi:cytochrome c oxidase subunit 2
MKYAGLVPFVIGVAAGAAGCGGNQSVLNPKSDPAAELALLSWILFGLGAFVLLIVIVAIALACVGTQAVRSALASHGMVISGGIAFPVVVLTALLSYGVWLAGGSQARLKEATSLRIRIVGEQWWWRINYETREGQSIASANELRIPVGRPTLLELASADVIHSFWVPSLAGKLDMMPGRTTRLRLDANASGIFRGQCAEYCGGPHALMAFEVVAMPPEEFDAWLESQAAPANDPSTPVTQRGRELFMSAGCGACHSIRGTEAVGTIGPDLTHLGSRRSVGVDTNRSSPEAIANFIREGQHIKPGNPMPPYRIFTTDELSALSIYLAGLK